MSEKNKNRKKELEDFLRYSQDQMSEEERNAFEKSLQQDPFDAEALEGLSSITPEEARAEVAGLQNQIKKRVARTSLTKRNTRTMWYRVAAAVTVLLVVTSVLFTLFNDRLGQLDRKVADSPEVEKEVISPTPPAEKAAVESSDEIRPIQSKVEDVGAEVPEKKESTLFKPVKAETEPEVASEIIAEETVEEELDREELADIQIEEAEEVEAAELALEEDIHTDEVAAPAQAMAPAMTENRPAAAKSMKRERVETQQVAGAVEEQQRILSGVVISGEDEQPLQGVVVAVKGSRTGTVTDQDGKFQISIDDDSQNTLIAQFIGMELKEVPVEDEDELLITLHPDAISLDEVVVIATAPKTVEHPTGYSVTLAESNADKGKSDYRSATPVGGKKEFNEYVKSKMQFPEHDKVLARAVVVLNFVVGYDGRPTQVLVLKSPGKAFSDEAIRLLMEGPDWQPAEMDGMKIEQATRIRIVFKKD
jgi:hypothetical protein